jgi:hypothetical protein
MNHEDLKLFKKFYEENKQISNQISNYPIDPIKKQQFIDKHIDSTDKSIIRELVNCIKHVSNIEFELLIKELCDKYNEVKEDTDIYILVYIGNMGSGSGGRWYNEKSSFYVTNIAAKYLKYDNIIDITTNESNIYNDNVLIPKISNYIKNLNIAENKNIYLYFSDDCSYGGQQIMLIITKFMNSLKESICNSLNYFYYRLIIPFILNKQVNLFVNTQSKFTNLIKNNFNKKKLSSKIEEAVIEYQIKYSHATFTMNNIYLIDILPTVDILIKNNSMVRETTDIVKNESIEKFGEKYLIYFDHKFADKHSINQKIIFPIIGICNYFDGINIYPSGYNKIIYKLNGKPIIFDQTKTLLELLKKYDIQTDCIIK